MGVCVGCVWVSACGCVCECVFGVYVLSVRVGVCVFIYLLNSMPHYSVILHVLHDLCFT